MSQELLPFKILVRKMVLLKLGFIEKLIPDDYNLLVCLIVGIDPERQSM